MGSSTNRKFHQSTSFAKNHKQPTFKKAGKNGSHGRTTALIYNYPKAIDKKPTVISKPKIFSKGELIVFAVATLFLVLRPTLYIQSRNNNPNPTAQSVQEGVNLESLSKKHKSYTYKWEASAEYRDLASFFKETVLRNDGMVITACMCLCLGTLSGPSWTTIHNSADFAMSQLVAFESMVELLRESMQWRTRGIATD